MENNNTNMEFATMMKVFSYIGKENLTDDEAKELGFFIHKSMQNAMKNGLNIPTDLANIIKNGDNNGR